MIALRERSAQEEEPSDFWLGATGAGGFGFLLVLTSLVTYAQGGSFSWASTVFIVGLAAGTAWVGGVLALTVRSVRFWFVSGSGLAWLICGAAHAYILSNS